jgi:hypothetical protein
MLNQPLLWGEEGVIPGETAIKHRRHQQNELGDVDLLALVGEKGQNISCSFFYPSLYNSCVRQRRKLKTKTSIALQDNL